jgi:hypothetical protein
MAPCFVASFVSISIGSRHFLPPRPGLLLILMGMSHYLFTRLIKDHGRAIGVCTHHLAPSLRFFSLLYPFIFWLLEAQAAGL